MQSKPAAAARFHLDWHSHRVEGYGRGTLHLTPRGSHRMRRALVRAIVIAACGLSLPSCAASVGGLESAPAMPAARAGLRPEYRVFYDALTDYGDWTVVEPYGYVFRPAVTFAT